MGRLTGRTALVTGGIRVIGRVIAETLATHGAGLAVTGRHADAVVQAVHELAAIGTKVLRFSANLRRYQEPHHLAEFTPPRYRGSISWSSTPE